MDVGKKIRALRRRGGLTLDQLAQRCGMTKGYLSKLEQNQQRPPISTLQTIAKALGVEIAIFFPAKKRDHDGDHLDLDIVRGGRRLASKKGGKASYGYDYAPLVENLRGKQMSPVLMIIHKGKTDAFVHDSEEFAYVVQGSIDLVYEGKRHTLEEGDCFYLDSRKKHRFENHHDQPAILVAVNYNYRRF